MGAQTSAHEQAGIDARTTDGDDPRVKEHPAERPADGVTVDGVTRLNELEEHPVEETGYGHGV